METVERSQLVEQARASLSLPAPAMQKAIIDQAGVTEVDVAKVVGVHRVTVNRWVMGHRRPTGELLTRYAALLTELQAIGREHG
jgi:plasmid maintenance system antidote protein VapI